MIGFGLYQFCRNLGKWDMCLCFGCVGVGGDWVGLLGQAL